MDRVEAGTLDRVRNDYKIQRHYTRNRSDLSNYLDLCFDCHLTCGHNGNFQNLPIKPQVCCIMNKRQSYYHITYDTYRNLEQDTKINARKAYRLWSKNPFHPSLHFKCINRQENIWSIRITSAYHALGIFDSDVVTWFWIGGRVFNILSH